MEPIISPWFFYFIEVGDALDTITLIFTCIAGIAWAALWIAALCQFDEYDTFKENLQNEAFRCC